MKKDEHDSSHLVGWLVGGLLYPVDGGFTLNGSFPINLA